MAESLARLLEESEKRTGHRPALRFIRVSTTNGLLPDTLFPLVRLS